MKRSAPLCLAVALAGLAACQDSPLPVDPSHDPSGSGAAPLALAASGQGIADQYIVVFTDAVSDPAGRARQLAATHGTTLAFTYRHALKGFAARLPDAAVEALRRTTGVAYIEQDQVMRAIEVQTNATWGLDRVDQRDLPLSTTYEYNATGAGVKAYILDTGIRFDHAEFGGRASFGLDVIPDGQNGNDCNGHGTHVAGTVGGSIYGVAKNVTLVAVRVLNCFGSGTTAGVIQGVDWVTGNHQAGEPAAANMSLGGGFSTALNTAVENSIADGVTYAVAAGNSNGANACFYSPASAGPALTVGSTTSTDARSSFSNIGTCVDLFAPGSAITSAWWTSPTATNTISGTSMASPHTAGAAALYLQTDNTATPAAVEVALESNATANKVTNAGSGSPNLLLYTAFIAAGPPPPPPEPVPPPAAPSDLTAAAVDHQRIDLAWTDNADNETSFEVQRSQGGGGFALIATLGANATSYSNTGLAASTEYTYRVLAKNAGGSSGFSNEASATTSAPPPDTPPVARYTWTCGTFNKRTCSFNGTSSTDDKGIISYDWAWGDGKPPSSGATVNHRFPSNGTYQVTLTVKDAANQTGTRTCAVTTGTSGTCAP